MIKIKDCVKPTVMYYIVDEKHCTPNMVVIIIMIMMIILMMMMMMTMAMMMMMIMMIMMIIIHPCIGRSWIAVQNN